MVNNNKMRNEMQYIESDSVLQLELEIDGMHAKQQRESICVEW